jgi:alkanesulfonate monooxygenase SsuD/methylene tetrahydromethanopterin reductase-like flavin-dependent oxidoreductase (luciferase family)
MEFGLFDQLPCAATQETAARYQDVIRQSRLADELGLDSMWLAEYHFNPRFSVMPAPLLVASAIAQCTRNLKIGTAVNLLPLHHPVRLAEEVATLDVLSRGRAIFGIGRGSNPEHYEGMGISLEEGRPRFEEALEVVLKCWTEPRVSHQGEYYQVNEVSVIPRPIQQPHPPVYIAANSPETFPMVGSLGHNILVTPLIITSEGVRQGLDVYRQKLVENGHDPAQVKVIPTLAACAAGNRKKAEAILRPTIENYLGVLRGGRSRGSGRAVTLTCDEFLNNYAIVGDPQECIDQIAGFKELFDCQGIMFWHNIGGMVPDDDLSRSMKLLADQVLPHFK